MKRGSIITKTIFQIFVYLIELLGVSFVITCMTHYFIEPVLSYMQLIERMLMSYTIYQIFETNEQDTSFYNRDTNGKIEVTLSTCTDDSKARTIILARVEQ